MRGVKNIFESDKIHSGDWNVCGEAVDGKNPQGNKKLLPKVLETKKSGDGLNQFFHEVIINYFLTSQSTGASLSVDTERGTGKNYLW